jgi:hypothetical protein
MVVINERVFVALGRMGALGICDVFTPRYADCFFFELQRVKRHSRLIGEYGALVGRMNFDAQGQAILGDERRRNGQGEPILGDGRRRKGQYECKTCGGRWFHDTQPDLLHDVHRSR